MAEANESRASSSRARLRETEGLEACLSRDPNEVLRWKDENPLRLVAAALVDIGRPAKRAAIGEKLSPAVISPDEWDRWWSRIQPTLKESRHFSQDASHAIRLRATKPSEIEPASRSEPVAASPKTRDDKPRAAPSRSSALRLVDWIDWAQSDDEYVSIPRGIPPEGLAAYLRKQPAVLVPKTIDRLSDAIVEKILNANPSSRPSPGSWLDLLLASLDRWVDLVDRGDVSISDTIGFYTRLSAALGAEACQSLVKPLASYTSANVNNASVMADAILASSNRAPSETQALLGSLHNALGEPARKALWQRLITSDSGQISSWLSNRWRTIPAATEKAEVATSLIMMSQDTGIIGNMDSLLSGEWDFADGEQRQHLFNPILFGWFMHSEMMPGCRRVLRELAEQVGKNGASATDSLMRDFEEFIAVAAKDRLKRQGDDYENKLAVERGRLRDTEAELEGATTQLTFLQRENRTKRTAATLEITRDAIIVLGDALQGLAVSDVPRSREIGNLESKIVLALLTLGTSPFGEIGEIAPFDPKIHQADYPPEIETPVKIVAPGMRYSRGNSVSVTVVPMKVQRETQP